MVIGLGPGGEDYIDQEVRVASGELGERILGGSLVTLRRS